ncbi:MAG: cytotoxic translational repressor of toxin-antitoxin stability system [Burkholderiaceae bacterium]|nr:cytotoxic translational repressor of toxin-antitoxin stability system [Burkholderiaceae bacterium]
MTGDRVEGRGWSVIFSRKAGKQKDKLPPAVADTLYLLRKELEARGPVVPRWPHYGKIAGSQSGHYHCHLNKGHPTYVVVWQVVDKVVRILEIQFVGTHEKVNYSRFK